MKIISVSEPIVAVRQSQYPEDKKPEFLLVGRSNVGKSSFINAIVERKDIARVSSNPGKTQTLNFYNVNDDFYIVDVPGYGYANVSKQMQQKFGLMIEEYLANRDNLERVYMLVDFRIKPTNDDMLMYNFLKYHELPVTIVMTKVDKVSIFFSPDNKPAPRVKAVTIKSSRDKVIESINPLKTPGITSGIITFPKA